MMLKNFFYVSIVAFLFSCEESTDFDIEMLYGEWQVYEYGYSPGGDYVTKGVPDDPLQFMKFDRDKTFTSNYKGFEDYNTYTVEYDSTTETSILTLFSKSTEEGEQRSYDVKLDGKEARLNYRGCIEGCHIGLRKLD